MNADARATVLANELRMLQSSKINTFLLVEGDDDSRFFRKFINEETCIIRFGRGKQVVLKTYNLLKDSKLNLLVIVDADFDRITNSLVKNEDILYTDDHDLNLSILRTNALRNLLIEYGDAQKISSLTNHKSLLNYIVENIIQISITKFLSYIEVWNLKFSKLKYPRFIDSDTLTTNFEIFIEDVLNNSQFNDRETILQKITSTNIDEYDRYQLTNGHDVNKVLLIGLKEKFGSQKCQSWGLEILEKNLRLAFEYEDFRKMTLFSLIENWERVKGIKILQERNISGT